MTSPLAHRVRTAAILTAAAWSACLLLPLVGPLEAADAPSSPAAPPAPTVRGYAGFHVEPLSILSPAQKADLGVKASAGNVVAFVLPDGPAAKAGLRVGDMVVRLGGRDVTVLTTGDRYEAEHRRWRAEVRQALDGLAAHVPVEVVVERGGTRVALTLTPASEAEIHRMMGGDESPFPSPATAGAPAAYTCRFDDVAVGGLPAGFRPYEGRWQVAEEAGAAPRNALLRQDRPVLPWAVLLVTGPGRALADGHVTVRFQPVSGVVDASAGVVFRAQDPKNYYLVRANALEDNFDLYVVKDGVRTTLVEARVTPPAPRSWHTMEVGFRGDTFRAVLDGKDVVEGKDATFASGWCGLWTKADSVTWFDDLRVEPAAR